MNYKTKKCASQVQRESVGLISSPHTTTHVVQGTTSFQTYCSTEKGFDESFVRVSYQWNCKQHYQRLYLSRSKEAKLCKIFQSSDPFVTSPFNNILGKVISIRAMDVHRERLSYSKMSSRKQNLSITLSQISIGIRSLREEKMVFKD